jgi:hypothetical protein
MAEPFTIELILQNAQARAAAQAQVQAFGQVATAAEKAAQRQQAAIDKAAQQAQRAAERKAAQLQAIEDKLWMADQKRQAQREAAAEKAAQRAVAVAERAAQRQRAVAERAAQRAAAQVERENQRAEAARVRAAERTAQQLEKIQDRYILKAYRAERDAAMQAAKAQEQNVGWFAKSVESVAAYAAGFVGLNFAVSLLRGIGQAVGEAAEHQAKLTEEFIRYRDAQREFQAMQGGTATTKAALAQAQFEVGAGMTPQEALAFRTGFANYAQQYNGRTITEAQYAQFEQEAARLTTAVGIEPQLVGELAGRTAGFRDFRRAPEGAPLGELYEGLQVLQHGAGGNRELVQQAARITARLLSSDEATGVFQKSRDAYILESVLAEASPDESEVYARAAVRAVRAFQDKTAAPLLQQAGVTPQTEFFAAVRQIGAVVQAEARAKGLKTYDVLAQYYGDEREKNAMAVLINKGLEGGLIAERQGFAASIEGKEPAKAAERATAAAREFLRKSETDPEGTFRARQAEAQRRAAELGRGAETSVASVLQKQAEAQLIAEREIDTASTKVTDFLMDATSPSRWLGFSPTERQQRINLRTKYNLIRRGRAAGLEFKPTDFDYETQEGFDAAVNKQLERFKAAGIDPYTGKPLAPAAKVGPQAALGGGPGLRTMIAAASLAALPEAIPAGELPRGARGGPGGPGDMSKVEALLGRIAGMMEAALSAGGRGTPGPTPAPPPLGQPFAPRAQFGR